MEYLFDHHWQEERARLRNLEKFFDPYSFRDIEDVGIRPGWRCLEVGGGGGSIAEWLAWRVGPTGKVLVTDLETRFLDVLVAQNLEVRRHDIASDPLPPDDFDLVHSRAVLEHVTKRDEALDRMVQAVRPGGWLVIESSDFRTCVPVCPAHDALFGRVFGAFHRLLGERGFHDHYGRELTWQLRRRGLEDVHFSGRIFEWGGSEAITPFQIQTFQRLRIEAEAKNRLSTEELDAFFAMISAPDFRALSHLTCVVRGRKPARR